MTETTPTTEAPDLWAVHVAGPDDLRATVSREQAYRLAEWLNLGIATNPIFCGSTDTAPLIWASPARWTGTPQSHAESLASEDRDPRWSTVDDAMLACCARGAFGAPKPATFPTHDQARDLSRRLTAAADRPAPTTPGPAVLFPAAEMFALGAAVCRIVEQALWGCEEGGLIDGDDTSIPVSEFRRLLWEAAGPCIARLLAEARTPAALEPAIPVPAADLAEPEAPARKPLILWERLSERDQAAAVAHWQACDGEGFDYARREYPVRWVDDPALVALDRRAANEHADRVAEELVGLSIDDIGEGDILDALGRDEWYRLLDVACGDKAATQAGAGA